MTTINIEIKARTNKIEKIRETLRALNADFRGTDHQIDTYFNVRKGRLKLRQGGIENKLIFYQRSDKPGPKQSNVILYESNSPQIVKNILAESIGIKVIVDKQREIYYIDNVKFHIDKVKGLGDYVEIEANDNLGKINENKLLEQCQHYMKLLEISDHDLIKDSYSDLMVEKQSDKDPYLRSGQANKRINV